MGGRAFPSTNTTETDDTLPGAVQLYVPGVVKDSCPGSIISAVFVDGNALPTPQISLTAPRLPLIPLPPPPPEPGPRPGNDAKVCGAPPDPPGQCTTTSCPIAPSLAQP